MSKDYVVVNPIEELLKAIEIVHGLSRRQMWERLLLKYRSEVTNK